MLSTARIRGLSQHLKGGCAGQLGLLGSRVGMACLELEATETWGHLVCKITTVTCPVQLGMETWSLSVACVPQQDAPSSTSMVGPCGWDSMVLSDTLGGREERCLPGHPGVTDPREEYGVVTQNPPQTSQQPLQ